MRRLNFVVLTEAEESAEPQSAHVPLVGNLAHLEERLRTRTIRRRRWMCLGQGDAGRRGPPGPTAASSGFFLPTHGRAWSSPASQGVERFWSLNLAVYFYPESILQPHPRDALLLQLPL